MRIGIDGRALQGSRTGIGRYVYELCRELDRILPDAQFFVYSSAPLEMPVLSDRWVLRLDESSLAKNMKAVLWLKYRCGQLCDKDNLDVFWGAATFLPQLRSTVRTVITVYDLTFKVVPNTMSVTHRWAFSLFFKKDVARANIVLAISKGTSDRLYDFFGRGADAIVYPAVGTNFTPQSDMLVQDALSQYALIAPYILAVATWEPRKNLELLIRVFLKMKAEGLLNEHKLVLAGGRGWKDQRLVALLDGTDSVIPLGYIPDDHLVALYSGADLFIFPSLYEGFGMPVREALACGAKVLTSDIPELREAGGDDAVYAPPTFDGIQRGILTGLAREKPAVTIGHHYPSWTLGAKKMITLLVGAAGSGPELRL